jgi:hypothetical protein
MSGLHWPGRYPEHYALTENLMNKKTYKSRLAAFVTEIKELDIAVFKDPDTWVLSDELENSVKLGYKIPSSSERSILHHIGQRYGLIPLCPGEVVDLEYSEDQNSMFAVVRTEYGSLPLKRKRT